MIKNVSWILFLIIFFGLWITAMVLSIKAAPIRTRYDKESDIRAEFLNLYLTKQDKGFDVVNSTPRIADMQEFNPIVFSSGVIKFLVLVGTTIYKVEFSTN